LTAEKTNNKHSIRKIKLMMLILGYEYGGQAVSTLNLIKTLPGHGIEVLVVACCPGELCERISKLGQKVIILDLPKPPHTQSLKKGEWKRRRLSFGLIHVVLWLVRANIRFFKVCRRIEFDELHCSYGHPALIGGLSAKLLHVTLICHQRYPFSESGIFWIERVAANYLVTHFVANSNFVKSTMPKKWQHKITVIHNGIEDMIPAEDDTYLRRMAKVSENGYLIGMAGTFLPVKGWDDFVKVANLSQSRHMNDLHFVAIGGKSKQDNDDYWQHLESSALNDSVQFVGRIPESNRYFQELSVFLFCTRKPGEAFGLVIVEAMLAGVAVVAYANGAVLEIIEDGQTGILVPDGDVNAMLESVQELVGNPTVRNRLGANGRERVLKVFSVKQLGSNMAKVIRQIVSNS